MIFSTRPRRPPPGGLLLLVLVLGACGIEDIPYLEPVPDANINRTLNNQVEVRIPGTNPGKGYFTHYTIFYRIYVSGTYESSPDVTSLTRISTTLASDYARIDPYVDKGGSWVLPGSYSTTSLFSNFYTLELEEGVNINDYLGSGILGTTLVFDFTQEPGYIPRLNDYLMRRSNGSGRFSPKPEDRYFVNTQELYDSANAISTVNADVVPTGSTTIADYNTYACFYIVAVGVNSTSFTPIYSTPAFVGVLLLPSP